MKSYKISDTYKLLYHEIIEELLWYACNAKMNYCVRAKTEKQETPIAIGYKYEEYKNKALANMTGERLDRHKLASCICGALIEVRPLVGVQGAVILKRANEILALHVGLNVIKAYMIHALLDKLDIPQEEKQKIHHYLKENFDMQFPENICDSQSYEKNLENALYWSHHKCNYLDGECFNYDIWAYSKIFFHLELYNQGFLKKCYEEYLKKEEI